MTPPADSPSSSPAQMPGPFTRIDWVLLTLVLVVPVVPNLVYLATVPPRSFWLGEVVTSGFLVLSPLLFDAKPRTTVALLSPFAALTPFVSAYAIATGYP